ncbi:MAG: diguanylate cyclase [Eubacteriales bacterium]|nr:diguanylate cyclase [Eubacteriales bacterium]MDD3881623.1 diguanylate cyclase [Eubacteriales bacterium]MDD4512318.1 diguanylate cyclase [Eubacteriales bacterium]
MTQMLYAELNAFGIAVLVFLLYYGRRFGRTRSADQRMYSHILLIAILIMLLDTGTWLIDGAKFDGARVVSIVLSTLYFIAVPFISYAWLLFCDYKVYGDETALRSRMRFYSIPVMLNTALMIVNVCWPCVFSVDEAAVYSRGNLFVVHAILGLGYLLYASVLCLVKALRVNSPDEKRDFRCLASFIILPTVGAVLQAFFYGTSLVWPCTVLSCLVVFINVQSQHISIDLLTRLNNRRQLNRYLSWVSNNVDSDKNLYAVMVDIDGFRRINSEYGHSAGDSALIRAADIMKRVCRGKNDFLARTGDDEFVLICQRETQEAMRRTMEDIDNSFVDFNSKHQTDYVLMPSMGCAVYNPEVESPVDTFLSQAEKEMIAERNRKECDRISKLGG